MIKVAIADNNSLFRAGIHSSLAQQTEIIVTNEIANVEQLHETFCFTESPDVLILNFAFANVSSFELLEEMCSRHPNIPVITIGMLAEETYAARAIRAGAAAYLKVDCTLEELIEAVRVVKSGKMYLSSRCCSAIVSQLQNRHTNKIPHSLLSDREYQIFTMICQGIPLVKIGQTYQISVKTVSTYRARILKKMNLHNNAELIQYAVKYQIVQPIPA